MTKYIIGGGLSGLIAAYYLKDYYLICNKDDIGGQFNSLFSLGPRYIHYNKQFENLLKELKIKYKIKKARVGYFYKNEMHTKLTEEMKQKYALKTRNSKDDKSFLNNKSSSFEYLDFNMKTFINRIYNKIKNRHINHLVKKINLKNKMIILNDDSSKIYDKIISTIHYKDFCKLINKRYHSNNKDIYFYLCEKLKNDFKNFDFVYIIDKNNKINRITYNKKYKIIESPTSVFFHLIMAENIISQYELKDYKLSNKNTVEKFKNIIFLGRYANLDNSKKINNVIDDIKKLQ